MEPGPFPEEVPDRNVRVVGSELVESYTVYIIEVADGQHRWTMKHRYSDFYDLHEKLSAAKKVDRHLLPPKKILGKNSKSLVERRQKELELYLQTLLQQFPEATPTPLASFLHFHLYEINGITAALAEELFHKGEQLLQAGGVFSLRPLQLYSVSQQLRLAKPTCFTGDAKTDLGHILDFTCRLRYLKIPGTRGPIGDSNIQEDSLTFDLSIFKSLLQIEISDCSSQQILGLAYLRSSLATLSIHRSTESMMSVLVPEASEFSQWEPEGAESGCPVTAVVPVWRHLTTLDMSHNCISSVDGSVKLIRKVEFLDLSYNQMSSVEHLQGYLGPAGNPYLPTGIPQVPPAQHYSLPSDQPGALHSMPPTVTAPPNSHAPQDPYMSGGMNSQYMTQAPGAPYPAQPGVAMDMSAYHIAGMPPGSYPPPHQALPQQQPAAAYYQQPLL